jgi:hypothetical protein
MARIASLVICALMLALFVISQSFSSPNGVPQNPALAGLEEEIKRVEAEIDKIFAETLAQLPSIPNDLGNRMKRVHRKTGDARTRLMINLRSPLRLMRPGRRSAL